MSAPRVGIIGGGLAGLTAAFRLQDRCDVTLVEAQPRWGGQIETANEHGFLVERGAEGFVARSVVVPQLARDLGFADDALIGQAELSSYAWDGRELVVLGPGEAANMLGFQVPQADLGKGIRTMRGGMGSLIDALASQLAGRVSLRRSTRAHALHATGRRLRLQLESGAELELDSLIVATSAVAAARILSSLAGAPAEALARAVTHSSVTVELAYERASVEHPLAGSGFIVAPGQSLGGLRACTFTSSKFAGRAAESRVSLRAFFRPSGDELALDDATWSERAQTSLEPALRLRGAPLHVWVSRWPQALPAFDDAHHTRVSELERVLGPLGAQLAGSAFHGSGIDAAVRSAERAAANTVPG